MFLRLKRRIRQLILNQLLQELPLQPEMRRLLLNQLLQELPLQPEMRQLLLNELLQELPSQPEMRLSLLQQLLQDLHLQPAEVQASLSSNIRLALGIPASLGDPLPVSVGAFGHYEFTSVFVDRYCRSDVGREKSLDLGCGTSPENPFNAQQVCGCDLRGSLDGSIIAVDLFNKPIPFEANSFDYATAFDFVEHIPRVGNSSSGETRFPFIEFMGEVERILKPGGYFLARTPAVFSKETFQDPTHVNFITKDTFPSYFCAGDQNKPWARMYGFKGDFEFIAQEWCHCWLFSLIRKLDP
ncbi:MAG: methyltransferase domain-containing protein [Cyanobacteriota bacterium]|jgi:SAM-dependent methyltransferase